ncbi:hypothetical protein [Novosphingobium sp.]|uniref:hypothetical protein n=1 Tax=Novosphingobium sp. TaxID=1874826 RepID=UPI0038BE1A3D
MPFDLLGDPVPVNKGCRGRPQHAKNPEIFESMIRCFGLGWSEARVARAHRLAIQTMNDHYFSTPEERKARQAATDLYEAELLARLDHQSRSGKTAATAHLLKRYDKARLGATPDAPKRKKKPKGLKETRREDAWTAGAGDADWGELIGPQTRPH